MSMLKIRKLRINLSSEIKKIKKINHVIKLKNDI